jgi:PAS domain S-box-containing protein
MNHHKTTQDKFNQLRTKAEQLLLTKENFSINSLDDDPLRLINELQTLQVELEIQNEELILSQQNLMDSQRHYIRLYDFSPVGYVTVSNKHLIKNTNLTFAKMVGIERHYLLDQPLSNHVVPDDQDICYEHLRALSNCGTQQVCELRMVKKDHSQFYVHLESTVVLSESSNSTQFNIVLIDITEQNLIKDSLKKNEEFTKRILEASLNGLYIYDIEQQNNIYVNPQYSILTGYTLKDLNKLTKQGFFELFHPDDLPKIQQYISDIKRAKDNEIIEIEYRFRHKNEKWMWLISRGAVFTRDRNGTVQELIGTFLDITNLKESEIQIRETLSEKETLLREIYHRTKNNMQVIMAMINLQVQSVDDESVLSMFKEMINRINTMALVHQKLYQTKNLSKIDLKEYFTDLIDLLIRNNQNFSDKVKIKTDMDPVMVTIDIAIPCGLILNELVSNTFKHAFSGNLQGEVKVQLKEKDGGIEIKFKDNGVGLPERFDYRKAKSMGLSTIVALIEHQLGGTINLINDKGTAYQIHFGKQSDKKKLKNDFK